MGSHTRLLFITVFVLLALLCHGAVGSATGEVTAASDAVTANAHGHVTPLPDFDGDGTVGFADFVMFSAKFGFSQGDNEFDPQYDLNGDGAIGFADFVDFAQHFGKDVPSDDRAVLMALYHATDGPNWVNSENWLSDAPLGEWTGVYIEDYSGRVEGLELRAVYDSEAEDLRPHGLKGSIPPELGRLARLRSLDLGGNNLSGPIPPELDRLARLEHLDLSGNDLSGPIPPEFGRLSNLRYLYLSDNNLSGPIPSELGMLSSLESLFLSGNDLSGAIPQSFLQIDELLRLHVEGNDRLCVPGTSAFDAWLRKIGDFKDWDTFCNAADVEALKALYESTGGAGWTESSGWSGNEAVEAWHGVTADSLGRVTALDLTRNGLAGRLPRDLGALADMTELRFGDNSALTGRLPLTLIDLSLRTFHYSGTSLCASSAAFFRDWLGSIRSHKGTGAECPPLTEREILEALYVATGGAYWRHSENWMTDAPLGEWYGVEADEQGTVRLLQLSANQLEGSIPLELAWLAYLEVLNLSGNDLTGTVPPQLANLAKLKDFVLNGNELTGVIPPEFSKLAELMNLSLGSNGFSGRIPPELGDLINLERLHLGRNRLTGPIPSELGNLHVLLDLNLAENRLTGSIPPELGDLAYLETLYLGGNELTGTIPSKVGDLTGLRTFALQRNSGMSGALPLSLMNLLNLEVLQVEGTGLCAPSDAGFLGWLKGVPIRRLVTCGGDLPIAYLVQAVQAREFPVPLVAGEKALLRVFPTANQATGQSIPAVRARFFVNGRETHVQYIPGKSDPIPSRIDESSLSTSANAEVAGHVIQPGLEMEIEVDPKGTLDPGLGVATRIPETGRMDVDVRSIPLFELTLVPFLWTEEQDAAVLEAVRGMSADPKGHEMLDPTRTLLPVGELGLTAHEKVMSSSNNAYDLLDQTRAIRVIEGGTGYWMGMLSGDVTGPEGVAFIGGKSSFSINDAWVIAHEFGHSFSLPHAPCGGAGGPDPAYPTPDGTIGVWGYDFEAGRLVPPNSKDIMGYCENVSIAGYFFTKACHFRLNVEGEEEASTAVVGAPSRSLFLWGDVDADGVPRLKPAFVIVAPPALPRSDGTGEHRLAGRADDGRVLFAMRFHVPMTADGDGRGSFVFSVPIDPAWDADVASIELSGPGGSDTLDGDSDRPMAIVRDVRTRRVRGFFRDLPRAAVAQHAALAAISAPQGLEVLFSRGIPDDVIKDPDDADPRR